MYMEIFSEEKTREKILREKKFSRKFQRERKREIWIAIEAMRKGGEGFR